ncbi:ABC-three component system protein [Variovorax sp. 770b2]|uniref:ABC-three component system protein n=1 Tax=Variovorax sp. 770b2 TaxID=1566271 RepID=UPI0008F35BFF|nr:ABC-three component system protein [Variovorax sp. 770b2]SFQ23817.1 hypothetical protein SAMN03159339_6193 [Variovorax sp. 770b2]
MTDSAKHSAPGPYLGFALQPVRLCYHLLSCPETASVSIEHLDDVAVHYADGTTLLEQSKSALSHNALADWSKDLWKTVANWVADAQNGTINCKAAYYQIYVTPIKTGKISTRFHEAKNAADVMALTADVTNKLKLRKSLPDCIDHVNVFLNADEAIRRAIVINMRVVSAHDDPIEALRELLKPTTPANVLDQICASAIGIAQEQANKLLREKKQALVSASEFRKQFHAFVQKNNLPGLLTSFAEEPPSAEVQYLFSSRPCFVQQLDLIQTPPDQQMRAVSDYLRTRATKTEWATRGAVYEGSFDEWDQGLLRHYNSIRSEVAEVHSEKPEASRGRITYNQCTRIQQALEGREVPLHFCHGSFNVLADQQLLGWHPRYKDLLR